ncbi:MAG: hypothetical protein EOP68_04475 [Sphingomonas sp.]|nr:MAG: hypothetical protein EOP68_04475 [Sphingomonas sp.]
MRDGDRGIEPVAVRDDADRVYLGRELVRARPACAPVELGDASRQLRLDRPDVHATPPVADRRLRLAWLTPRKTPVTVLVG